MRGNDRICERLLEHTSAPDDDAFALTRVLNRHSLQSLVQLDSIACLRFSSMFMIYLGAWQRHSLCRLVTSTEAF